MYENPEIMQQLVNDRRDRWEQEARRRPRARRPRRRGLWAWLMLTTRS